jgi:hypothetical protein
VRRCSKHVHRTKIRGCYNAVMIPSVGAGDRPKRAPRWVIWLGGIAVLGIVGAAVGQRKHPGADDAQSTKSSATRDSCGDLGGFHVCVEAAELRSSLANDLEGLRAGANATFVLLKISLSSSKRDTTTVGWSDFTLRSDGGNSWDPDTDAQLNITGAGYQTINLLDQLHPGLAIGGWIVFLVPRNQIGTLYFRFKPGFVKALDLALPVLPKGPSCESGGQRGACIDVGECGGKHVAGLCEGPDNIVCCIASPPASAPRVEFPPPENRATAPHDRSAKTQTATNERALTSRAAAVPRDQYVASGSSKSSGGLVDPFGDGRQADASQLSAAESALEWHGDDLSPPPRSSDTPSDARSLDNDEIRTTLAAQSGPAQQCVMQAAANAEIKATITVKMVVDEHGSVAREKLQAPHYLFDHGLLACMRSALGGMHFPVAGVPTLVTMPLNLAP